VGQGMSNHIVLLTDVHFGIKKNKEYFLESQINFFKEMVVPYLKENNIDTVCILGDLFDNRSVLNIMIKNEVFNLFDTVLKEFTVYLLVGNHDSYYNSSIDVNSLKFFSKFENVILVEEMINIQMNNKLITMVPWIVNQTDFVDKFSGVECDVCLGHFNITGTRMNKMKLSEDGIQRSIFSNCKRVFSGHFHTRSVQKYGGCEIVYVGSPMQFDRGDMGEERGFIDLNLDTLEYEYINNAKSIRFNKINYPEIPTNAFVQGNLIDVYVDVSAEFNEKDFEKYLVKLEAMRPIDSPNVFVVNPVEHGDSSFKITENNISSIPELMLSYVSTLNLKKHNDVYEHLMTLYAESRGENNE